MNKKAIVLLTIIILINITACSEFRSKIKDYSAEWIGLEREFHVYDDAGNETMFVKGKNTDMQKSSVANVIRIEVDGHRWQHVGSTMIAYETGLENYVDRYKEKLILDGRNSGSITAIDKELNEFVARLTGLQRIVIVKTQRGVPIAVFDGNNVFIEESSLPDTTKVLIDNKRLHIYRADLEVIEKSLIR